MEGIRRALPPAPTPHRPTTCISACPPLALDELSVIRRPVHRSPVLYIPSPSLLESIMPAVLPSPAASHFLSPRVVSKAHKHAVIFPVLKNPSLDPTNPCKTKSDVVTPAQNPSWLSSHSDRGQIPTKTHRWTEPLTLPSVPQPGWWLHSS